VYKSCFKSALANIYQDVTLAHYAGYTEDEIEPVFKLMIDYLARPVTHEAFFKKYASKKFLKGKQFTSSSRHHLLTLVQLRSSPDNGQRSMLLTLTLMSPFLSTPLRDNDPVTYIHRRLAPLAHHWIHTTPLHYLDGT
jgi:hypothetical protein